MTQTTLGALAKLIRSKNAGPFHLTFDLMFSDEATYRRVRDANVVTPELFARLYATPLEEIVFAPYDAGLAIKVTIPRSVASGDVGDTDVFGGQQYGPLVDLVIP